MQNLLKDNFYVSILDFDIPKNKEHGDLSTNICMRLSKILKDNPKSIAEKLIGLLDYDKKLIDKIEKYHTQR